MKAEQRKELATNDLAAGIDKLVKGVKEGPSSNTVTWTVLVVAGIALVGGLIYTWTYFSRQSKLLASDRWDKLAALDDANAWLVNVEELQKFADDKDNAGTPQALLARFKLARYWIQSDRDIASPLRSAEARKKIKDGRDLYVKLIDESSDVAALQQEAIMGAGKGSEALGEIDQAKKYYDKLTKEYPKSLFGKDAAKQLERLNKDGQDLDALKAMLDKKGP